MWEDTLKELKKIKDFDTPVVALTADANAGSKEKYLSQGFFDYISKPFNKNQLDSVLKKVFKDEECLISTSVEEPKEEKKGESTKEEYLKSNGFDLDKALESLGDMEMYDETIKMWIEENDKRIVEMGNYLKDKDMENYSILVHALKSDCKYIGLFDLADLAYDHELKSKANDYDYISKNYDSLINKYNESKKKVEKYINEYLN